MSDLYDKRNRRRASSLDTSNPWEEYERRKAELQRTAKDSKEYDEGIRRIVKDLGI